MITLDGVKYPFGLGMHPEQGQPFIVKYELKGAYRTLTTGCGVNGSSPGQSSPLIFTVTGDGRQLWKSAPIKTLTDVEFATINVKGVKVLELRTECTGGRDGAHACWLDPVVSK